MELRDLKTFAAVARHLGFGRAGEALNAAQSTVSARIALLEEELGVPLFDRIGRKVVLTDAGTRLLDFARRMLDLEDEARRYVVGDGEGAGTLTIRVPESLCVHRLMPVIRRFRERFGQVRLSLVSCTLDGLEADLRQGVTDLAFVYMDAVVAGDLQVECLGTEPLVLAAARRHPLARRKRVAPEHLAGVPLLLSKGDCAYRRSFEALLAEGSIEPGVGLEFQSLAALKGCLALGLGVAPLPALAVRAEASARTLAVLPWAGEPLETGVLMIRHRKKWVSPLLGAFLDLAREELGSQLA